VTVRRRANAQPVRAVTKLSEVGQVITQESGCSRSRNDGTRDTGASLLNALASQPRIVREAPLIPEPPFPPAQKCESRTKGPAEWDGEWYYHLRPFSCVEWVDIDPVDRDHSPPIDHTAEVEAALRRIHVPFSREGQYLRVWGYTRPGSAAVFA